MLPCKWQKRFGKTDWHRAQRASGNQRDHQRHKPHQHYNRYFDTKCVIGVIPSMLPCKLRKRLRETDRHHAQRASGDRRYDYQRHKTHQNYKHYFGNECVDGDIPIMLPCKWRKRLRGTDGHHAKRASGNRRDDHQRHKPHQQYNQYFDTT